MGFPRQEYWSGLPFPSPGDLPTQGSNIAGGFFTSEPLYTQLPVIIIYLWLLAYPKLIVTTSAHIKISNSEWEFGQNAEKEEIEGKYWSQRLLLMEFFPTALIDYLLYMHILIYLPSSSCLICFPKIISLFWFKNYLLKPLLKTPKPIEYGFVLFPPFNCVPCVATGLEKVRFHSNPKERQCQRMLKLPHNYSHLTH